MIDDIIIGGVMTKAGTPRTERDLERQTKKRSEYSSDEKARYERYGTVPGIGLQAPNFTAHLYFYPYLCYMM